MQFLQTNAIILQKIQIKDFKYILKLFSEQRGLLSAGIELNHFIQPAHLQLFNICHFLIFQNKYQKNTIKEIKPIYIYKHLPTHFKKNSIAQFITEILLKTTKEDLLDKKLYQFAHTTLIELDNLPENQISVFHLFFLRNFIEVSGHFPVNNYSSTATYFDISEGRFSNKMNENTLSKDDSQHLLNFLFDKNFLLYPSFPVLKITHHLLNYIKYHLGLQEIHSLTFLKEALMESEI